MNTNYSLRSKRIQQRNLPKPNRNHTTQKRNRNQSHRSQSRSRSRSRSKSQSRKKRKRNTFGELNSNKRVLEEIMLSNSQKNPSKQNKKMVTYQENAIKMSQEDLNIDKKINENYTALCNKIYLNPKEPKSELKRFGIECIPNQRPNVVNIRTGIKKPLNIECMDDILTNYKEITDIHNIPLSKTVAVIKEEPFQNTYFINNNFIDNIPDIFENVHLYVMKPYYYEIIPVDETKMPAIGKQETPSTIYTFMEKQNFKDNIKKKIQSYMILYSFYRSYIDFYHDFEYLAPNYIQNIRNMVTKTFVNSLPDRSIIQELAFIRKLDEIDTYVKTTSNGVNQTSCKRKCQELLEEYCQILIRFGIYWLTPTKASAFIASINPSSSILSSKENQDFIDILKKDDQNKYFYIETDKSHATEFFIKNGFDIIKSISGLRDAGPKVTNENAKKMANKEKLQDFTIWNVYRSYNPTSIIPISLKNNDFIIQNNPNYMVSDFLFGNNFKIYVNNSETTNEVAISYLNKTVGLMNTTSTSELQLSVNKLLATIHERQLRGEKNASEIKSIEFTPNVLDQNHKTLVLMLKTYTDFIQLLDIYDLKDQNIRAPFVTLDMLCENSGMLFGLNTILSEHNKISYYCYDIRYHSIDIEVYKKKYFVFSYIREKKQVVLDHIQNKLNVLFEYIARMNRFHYHPAIYYSTQLLLINLENIKKDSLNEIERIYNIQTPTKNDIQKMPETIEKYILQITEASRIESSLEDSFYVFDAQLKKIYEIGNRTEDEEFVNIFFEIRQNIINSLPNTIPETEFNIHVSLFFASIIQTKNFYSKGAIDIILNTIIENPNYKDIHKVLNQIKVIILLITEIDTQIQNNEIYKLYLDSITATISAKSFSEQIDNSKLPYSLLYELVLNFETKNITNDKISEFVTEKQTFILEQIGHKVKI